MWPTAFVGRFDDLWSRFEPADESNRWDAPLFRVDGDGDEEAWSESFDAIRASVIGVKVALPMSATTKVRGLLFYELWVGRRGSWGIASFVGQPVCVWGGVTSSACAWCGPFLLLTPVLSLLVIVRRLALGVCIGASIARAFPSDLLPASHCLCLLRRQIPLAATNFLHVMDKATQEIFGSLQAALPSALAGDRVPVPKYAALPTPPIQCSSYVLHFPAWPPPPPLLFACSAAVATAATFFLGFHS